LKGSRTGKKRALHVVSVWASESQLTLAEIAVSDKSNEIDAVKKVLEIVDIKGNIVTSDAMNCQKEITEKITKQEADYVLCLKSNHEILHRTVEEHFMYNPKSADCDNKLTSDKGHGRVEQREYWLETEINFLKDVPEIELWHNLKSVGMVKTVVEKAVKTSFEIRYFLTSLTDINEFAHAVRQHWSIENHLHWRLDVIFREDASKVKKGNAPMNLHVLRTKSLSLLQNANMSKKLSMPKRRYIASLNTDVLEIILLDSNRAKS
jgi:predicted transposase YbfD/YdcC